MKLPQSQLKNEELDLLFQKSSIQEQHFFPRQVPEAPSLKPTDETKTEAQTGEKPKHEKQLEEN